MYEVNEKEDTINWIMVSDPDTLAEWILKIQKENEYLRDLVVELGGEVE